jgi:hypothetical protein
MGGWYRASPFGVASFKGKSMKIMAGIALSLLLHGAVFQYVSANNQLELVELQNKILVDQIQDLSDQLAAIRAARTYEDGVRDGIENSRDQSYMSGYHMAIQHIKGILPLEEAQATAGSP